MDYSSESLSSALIFPEGSVDASSSCVNITILDDSTLEDTQSFRLLAAVDDDLSRSLIFTSVDVTILDNDGMISY